MSKCFECDTCLTSDEIGLTKKLINRGATKFLCKNCLAKKFDVEVSVLNQKIEEFKSMGCALFL